MKTTSSIALGLCALATPLVAQQDVVEADIQDTQVVPAQQGDEGPLRYGKNFDFNPDNYVAKPMPNWAPVDHQGPLHAIEYDLETGRERLIPMMPSSISDGEGFVAGNEMANGIPEYLQDSMTGFNPINSTAYPWSAACRMFFTQTGGNFVCSAQVIDPCHVITAGHCAHEGNGGAWSTNVVIAPAWDGDSDAYGQANGTQMVSWTGWTQSGSFDHDQALVRLDRPVGTLTGWLGYGWNSSNSWWSSQTWNVAGYPARAGFTGAPHQLTYHWGTVDRVNTFTVEADYNPTAPDWIGGYSGTGTYHIDNGSRYVRCNVSYSWPAFQPSQGVGLCRMTEGKFDHYRDTFIPAGYPASVDYVPLQVRRVTSGSVRAGESLGGFNYQVFNRSEVDPASANVSVDVYASTNDNISTFDTKIQDHSFNWDFAPKSRVQINASGPTIPVTLTPGNYFLGVIIDETDASTANNDTDGWDATPFTVLEPVNSINLTMPLSAKVKDFVTASWTGAPPNSTYIIYYSKVATGSTISGHPFDVVRPAIASTGVNSASGTGSYTYRVPRKGVTKGPTWYVEIRSDSNGFVYDSNVRRITYSN